MQLRYLSYQDVASVGMSMTEIVSAVEDVFREKGEGRVEMPPKPGIHTQPDAFIHAMPAHVPAMQAAGMKWVSGYPGNQKKGLPYITGLMILNDPDTGIPTAVMDAVWITAMRTGAATAVGAKYLARPDSETVAILGCGVQGRSNLDALRVVLPNLRQVRAYDVVPEGQSRFLDEAAEEYGLEPHPSTTPEDAVREADVIVTAGPILKNPSPVIQTSWLKPGAFISPVDFDSYVKGEVFQAAAKLYTDDLSQQAYYAEHGYFKDTPTPAGDLGELVTGKKPGRETDDELTISLNLGLALEDMAVGVRVLRAAAERNIGTLLDL